MLKIRYIFIVLCMLFYSAASSANHVTIVSIGINVPVYPDLVVVPGYPVYYAPQLDANYFFYDGMYWVYQNDNWYESSWYNGPWWLVEPEAVPVFVLRTPVRYYRQPPVYFHGWYADAPPRWGDHWGHDWERHRNGWDKWHHDEAPPPAPLPVYQRNYSGDRYPRQVEQQHELHQQNYHYQPRDPVVRQHYQELAAQKAPAQMGTPQQMKQGMPAEKGPDQQDAQHPMPHEQATPHHQYIPPADPHSQPPQRRDVDAQKPAPALPQQGHPEVQEHKPPPAGAAKHEQPMPKSPGKGAVHEQKPEQERGGEPH